MDGYARTEDELFSSCLLNLTWESCYEQVGSHSANTSADNNKQNNSHNISAP